MERTFTGLAANNFDFVPTALILTGRSSWTGFFNNDFSGNSTCYSTAELIGWVYMYGNVVRSIVQGCNPIHESDYFDVDKSL